jgi:DNA polymerase type B, organellar and viral
MEKSQIMKDCFVRRPCQVEVSEKEWIKFKNHRYREPVPAVIYADFECKLVPDEKTQNTRHVPVAVGVYSVYQDFVDFECEYSEYEGPDCAKWLMQKIIGIADAMGEEYKKNVPLGLTPREQYELENAAECWICGDFFEDENEKRVGDHNHWTGEFRGAAHEECNLNYKEPKVIPVFLHNLTGYDAHIIISELVKDEKYGKLDILPNTKEKYISFSLWRKDAKVKIRFVDSYRFMAASLDTLGSNLLPEEKIHLFSHFEPEDYYYIEQKGQFPYEWLKSEEQLNQTYLPPPKDFDNKFNDTSISEENYQKAQEVWDHFDHENMREYMMLYLKIDVLLLADIFETFRATCLRHYELDPAHYLTAPSLAFDACLKKTKVELEVLQDIDMVYFLEEGIRGGVSQCSHRYARANIPRSDDFDPSEPPSSIAYLDANNLYGWAMSQDMPYANFSWMPSEEWEKIGNEGAGIGYFLEVDLAYPEHLHELHSDYPLAPEHRVPPSSRYGKKLLTTLFAKEKYIVYYKTLWLYLSLGMELTRIHRVVRFDESPWLAPYIELNTTERQNSKNDFEKDFFKLMNNSVFGKMIENVRKRRRVKIATTWEGRSGAGALIAAPHFHSRQIMDEDAVIIELNKTKICLEKPVYVGATILDMAKFHMYNVHYNMIKKDVPGIKMMYHDTDSFMYLLPNLSVHELIQMNPDLYDTSSYPEAHPLYSEKNKAVLGKMKDEVKGKRITHFIGLRSKMYSYKLENEEIEKKRAKGIRGPVLKKITFKDYEEALFQKTEKKVTQYHFESVGHKIFTKQVTKIGLSAKDDKRFVLPLDITRTLPWGDQSLRMYYEGLNQSSSH